MVFLKVASNVIGVVLLLSIPVIGAISFGIPITAAGIVMNLAVWAGFFKILALVRGAESRFQGGSARHIAMFAISILYCLGIVVFLLRRIEPTYAVLGYPSLYILYTRANLRDRSRERASDDRRHTVPRIKSTTARRILAGIIDLAISATVQAVLMYWFVIRKPSGGEAGDSHRVLRTLLVSFASVCCLVVRDIIGDRSIGKRVFGLAIVNQEDGSIAGFSRRLLRNLTWLFGPVEVACLLLGKKRLGDVIARTRIVAAEEPTAISQPALQRTADRPAAPHQDNRHWMG